jgi:hypothetical protein
MTIRPLVLLALAIAAGAAEVRTLRAPEGGIQPQAAVAPDGTVHLIWFRGTENAGDVFYATRRPGEASFGKAIQVDSRPGSAIAVGTIRGAQLALGREGRPLVAWNAQDGKAMWYAGLAKDGGAFEPQRNLVQWTGQLDGGGTIAADGKGHVLVAWSANAGAKDESGRAIYVAASADDGSTFAKEVRGTDGPTGACAGCQARAAFDAKGRALILYRGAAAGTGRDTWLLLAPGLGKPFSAVDLHPWQFPSCPMSSYAIAPAGTDTLLAWQTADQIWFARLGGGSDQTSKPTAAPSTGRARKHPTVAVNAAGEVLLAWTEGTGWKQGGSIAWQVYDKDGAASGAPGKADGLPAWGLATAFAERDGSFTIVY